MTAMNKLTFPPMLLLLIKQVTWILAEASSLQTEAFIDALLCVLPVSVTQNWKNKCDLKKKLLKHFMQITQSWISSQWNLCMSEDLNTDLTHLLATWKIDDKNVMLLETQLSHVEWLLYPRWNCESMKYYTAYFLLLGTINKCLNI